MKKATTKEELQEMIEEFKQDVAKDGHHNVSTEWVLTVMFDNPQLYDIKNVAIEMMARQL
ncbi:hypothetical protein D3C81_645630 [compost metagenome]